MTLGFLSTGAAFNFCGSDGSGEACCFCGGGIGGICFVSSVAYMHAFMHAFMYTNASTYMCKRRAQICNHTNTFDSGEECANGCNDKDGWLVSEKRREKVSFEELSYRQ